jgi:DNA-binding NarL/FixJ family response regulator
VCHASFPRDASAAVAAEPAKTSAIVPLVVDTDALFGREAQVTQYIAGACPMEIAKRLFLVPHTVRDHTGAIVEKAGASGRGELMGRIFPHFCVPLTDEKIMCVGGCD